jgi:hypothetical protein
VSHIRSPRPRGSAGGLPSAFGSRSSGAEKWASISSYLLFWSPSVGLVGRGGGLTSVGS